MNYPPKPWTNGQKFIENGTAYEYDASTKSWNFSSLTYNRLQSSIQFSVPSALSSFRIEFSEQPEFSSVAVTYNTSVIPNRQNFYVFSNAGIYTVLSDASISNETFKKLILIPDLDLNTRYFGRFRWTTGSSIGSWFPVIYPCGGGTDNNSSNSSLITNQSSCDDSELRTLIAGKANSNHNHDTVYVKIPSGLDATKLYGWKNGQWSEFSLESHNSDSEAHKILFDLKADSNHNHDTVYVKIPASFAQEKIYGWKNNAWQEITFSETGTTGIGHIVGGYAIKIVHYENAADVFPAVTSGETSSFRLHIDSIDDEEIDFSKLVVGEDLNVNIVDNANTAGGDELLYQKAKIVGIDSTNFTIYIKSSLFNDNFASSSQIGCESILVSAYDSVNNKLSISGASGNDGLRKNQQIKLVFSGSGTKIQSATISKIEGNYVYLQTTPTSNNISAILIGDSCQFAQISDEDRTDNVTSDGEKNFVTGFRSHSEGSWNASTGMTSHSEGNTTVASGDMSHSEGNLTQASGLVSHAEGQESKAEGMFSHAENTSTAIGDGSHSENNGKAFGDYSHAGGSGKALGTFSFAHGNQSEANADYSVALGEKAKSNAKKAVALGEITIEDSPENVGSVAGGSIISRVNKKIPNPLYTDGTDGEPQYKSEESHKTNYKGQIKTDTLTVDCSALDSIVLNADMFSRWILTGNGNIIISGENFEDGDRGEIVINTNELTPSFPASWIANDSVDVTTKAGIYVIEFENVLGTINYKIKWKNLGE